MSNVSLVILDWDGCLIDTFQSSYECYKEAFKMFNIKINKRIFKKNYSPDWMEIYKKFGINKKIWNEIDDVWTEIYSKKKPPLRKCAKELLLFLEKCNVRNVLLSGGSRNRVIDELKHYSLLKFFSFIVCQEDSIIKKPHSKLILDILNYTKCQKNGVVFIGDTHYDALMGKNAGVTTIIVKSGYSNIRRIVSVGPDYIVGRLSEVKEILERIIFCE